MNFRKLLTYVAFGTAAVMPFAGAQNPTILQGNYITNVFGNSNFVLNPNAQTNTSNIAVSNATVTRSTTTPLVATSEANVTVTVANGTIAWSTRTFDAGMRNGNCEARFTYRGFQSTSIAQVRQGATVAGANVVAQLTLTPSATDPRVASINFPCGDLSQPTYFVITDTSTLTGTNEIGGIYVGLATNLGQLNTVGVWQSYTPTVTPSAGTLTSTGIDFAEWRRVGENIQIRVMYRATQSTANAFAWTFSIPSGISLVTDTVTVAQSDRRTTSTVTAAGTPNQSNIKVLSSTTLEVTPTFGGGTFTSGTAYVVNFDVTQKVQGWGADPVVKPETQNVWAGVVYDDSYQILLSGTAANATSFFSFNDVTWNKPAKLKGKASVTTTNSGNDLGFSVDQLPVGNYKVTLTNGIYTSSGTTDGNEAQCVFRIRETTTGTVIARTVLYDARYSAFRQSRDGFGVLDGVFSQTSIAKRNFILEVAKQADSNATNAASCSAVASSAINVPNILSFTLTPLDQPSNSALYVQGPVLGAQTGAAISAGYVGETKYNTATITGIGSGFTTSVVSTISVTPGIWLVQAHCKGRVVAPTLIDAAIDDSSSYLDSLGENTEVAISSPSNTGDIMDAASSMGYYRVTSTKTLGAACARRFPTPGGTVDGYIKAIRLN